ncbi:hypothetical protein HHL25_12435 [Rhizobium sp. S-51]|uniref:Uncharacterized protein n=2 Tax=Rhizobium terricola TaxID=2728849 RepID=A0A7Y0AWT1_9HYPH|nr:hypothetical protein [Rhizobium terricola]NML74935.1 hypothetical protein [Rhizobium terricola]
MQAAKRTSSEEIRLGTRTLPQIRLFRYHAGMSEERNEERPAAGVHDAEERPRAAGPESDRDAAADRLRHADVAAARRKARAADKLRENLMRRKQQQRARRQGQADEAEGLPAANSPNRDD